MNIFICQTPFQLFYALQIIEYLKCSKLENTDAFTIIHPNLNINNGGDIQSLNYKIKSGLIADFRELKRIKNYIKKRLLLKNEQTRFFFSHKGGLLANYIYHNKRSRQKHIELNFFYEGILSFYDFKEKLQVFHFKRILTSLFLGYVYRFERIILPYNSDRIANIYTPILKYTKGNKKKIIEVPFLNNNKTTTDVNSVLILGGPISYLEQLYDVTLKEIRKSFNNKVLVYYKGHSSFDNHFKNKKNVFEKIMNAKNLNYNELDKNKSIESLMHEINPSVIYSYYSSALINIGIIFPNKYQIVCFIDENTNIDKTIISIFEHLNIKISFIK